MDDVRTDAAAAAYRGFLFSDLRGFTAFAERYGNSAAAAKVGRFLDIARTAIARHEGAEVKTEGDAIHAVFPSASSAVLCGLEIADEAAKLGPQEPDGWFDLGAGVHAGEAVETAEGYIGSAVNVAARLCSAARPGEVLVSSTVKGITQASIPVGFIAKGRRRLKGIREPVEIFAVTRDQTARATRAVPRPVAIGAWGIAAAVVLALAAVMGSQLLGKPAPSPANPSAAAATSTVQRLVIGPLPIGTYRSFFFQPRVTFDIRETGWTASGDDEHMLGLVRSAAPRGSVQFVHVDRVIQSPCGDPEAGTETGLGAADLLAQLRALEGHLTLSDQKTVQIGGYVGQQVDVAVADGALAACGGLVGGDVSIFGLGDQVWGATSGERFRLIALVVGDQAVTILLSTDWTQTPSVQELESLYTLGDQLLGSVRL
jgi:class 3 adenylate cyclase